MTDSTTGNPVRSAADRLSPAARIAAYLALLIALPIGLALLNKCYSFFWPPTDAAPIPFLWHCGTETIYIPEAIPIIGFGLIIWESRKLLAGRVFWRIFSWTGIAVFGLLTLYDLAFVGFGLD